MRAQVALRLVVALALVLWGRLAHAQQAPAPTSSPAIGITGSIQTGGTSLVIKAAPGNLYSVYATNLTANAGFLIVVNATAAPSPGALTASTVLDCIPLQASDVSSINYAPNPPKVYSVGIVALVSSSSGSAACTTWTTGSITAFISGSAP